jgi:pimeloyl-ACP methyl ester carboxylesterase
MTNDGEIVNRILRAAGGHEKEYEVRIDRPVTPEFVQQMSRGVPILDTVTLYWLSGTGGSSARIYWENFPTERSGLIEVPSAVSIFAKDMEKIPRRWVETRHLDLRYWNVLERGGHFPMLEVPDLYVDELRRAFTDLRPHWQ